MDDWKEDAEARLVNRAALLGVVVDRPTIGAEEGTRERGTSLCLRGRPSVLLIPPVGTGKAAGVIERMRGVRSEVLLKKRWREVEDVVYGIGTCS